MASLLALSRSASEHAKSLLKWRMAGHGGTFVVGCVALFVDSHWAVGLAIAGVVTQACAWILRWHGRTWHGRAEEARRYALLSDALGQTEDPVGARDLRVQMAGRVERQAVKHDDPFYYSTTAALGPIRLKEILQESVFFSKHLYRKAGNRAVTFFVLEILVLLVVTLIALGFAKDATVGPMIARTIVLVLLFFMAIDQLGAGLEWWQAATRARAVDSDLRMLTNPTTETLLPVFAEYSVATAMAMPIPTGLYESNRDTLNREWTARGKSSGGA